MKTLLGVLWPAATLFWSAGLLAFIACTVMALDGWDTNFGAAAAMLVGMINGAVALLLTIGAVLTWAIWRYRARTTEPYTALRNLLWAATAISVLALAMLLATGFELGSRGATQILISVALTGISAAVVSVEERHLSRVRATRQLQ